MIRMAVLLGVLLAGCSLASHAEEPGDNFLDSFQMTGVVDSIDFANLRLVVGDVQMPLATDVSILGPRGRTMALAEVQPGMKVGLVTRDETTGVTGPIQQIQVLPEHYNLHGSNE